MKCKHRHILFTGHRKLCKDCDKELSESDYKSTKKYKDKIKKELEEQIIEKEFKKSLQEERDKEKNEEIIQHFRDTNGIPSKYFRSSWEEEFANFLDSIDEPWLYEPKTFMVNTRIRNKFRAYTPDFKLTNRNLWIEIKGRWVRNYYDRYLTFKEKYPKEKIKVIEHKPPYTKNDLIYHINSQCIELQRSLWSF